MLRASRFGFVGLLLSLVFVAELMTPKLAHAQPSVDLDAIKKQVQQLYQAGKYAEAVPLAERYVGLARERYGEERTEFATAISWLAALYRAQRRYAEAEPLYQRALAIGEKALGPEHPDVGTSLSNLAGLYRDQGRYAVAEPLYKRALTITEKALGPDHPAVGTRLNNLALLYDAQGRYAEAEPLYQRALAIREKALGPDHPGVGQSLNNLAAIYRAQGRYAEAEPLARRALSITEKALGPDHPSVANRLTNLAGLYDAQRRYAEAEPLHRRALSITEKALGPEHPAVGISLNNLAALYRAQRRYAEAEPLAQRALTITEKALGPEHPAVGNRLSNLAWLYEAQRRYAEAEPLHRRALSITEKALGPEHPDVGTSLNSLAVLAFVQRDWQRAADYWRRSTSVTVRRAQRGTDDVGQVVTGKRKGEAEQLTYRFWGLVKAVHRLASEGRVADANLARETFQTAQWASASEAARSLTQMAVRAATADPGLSRLVRERQDLVGEWQKRDQVRSAAVSQAPDKRDQGAEATNVARLAAIDARIGEIDKQLATEFPEYAALVNPGALSVEDVQTQLGPREALVLFLDTPEWQATPEETFIWVITKTDARWVRVELGTKALSERVAALRCGLDQTLWYGGESVDKCRNALGASPGAETVKVGDKNETVQVLPFDLARAHELYKSLLGPVEEMIKGKHLLIAPSGPLTSLPFNVLVPGI